MTRTNNTMPFDDMFQFPERIPDLFPPKNPFAIANLNILTATSKNELRLQTDKAVSSPLLTTLNALQQKRIRLLHLTINRNGCFTIRQDLSDNRNTRT